MIIELTIEVGVSMNNCLNLFGLDDKFDSGVFKEVLSVGFMSIGFVGF